MQTNPLNFKTIAVATDLSETASSALRYAQAIARIHKSTLVVIHGIDPADYAFPDGVPEVLAADRAARNELKKIEEDIRPQGIPVHSAIESGIICQRILQAVADHRVDLLVLGTRAKTEAGRIALGTVARQLLPKAPCPILTVSPDADAYLPWAGRWRRIFTATDFSAASLEALRIAQCIVNVQLVVLHAACCANDHQCSHCLERLRFLAPFNESHTVPVNHIVAPGDAGEVITECARSLNADLVVLGSPEKELSAEDFHASTALQVIAHVHCPVLCVPSTGGSTAVEIIQEIAFAC